MHSFVKTMSQDVKTIIDEHIKVNYDYYHRVCKKYYNGRYIADDMVQELYLAFLNVKEDVILKFHSVNKLKNIGGKIALSLFNKRNQGTKNAGKSTSPLHEVPALTNHNDTFVVVDKNNFKDNDAFLTYDDFIDIANWKKSEPTEHDPCRHVIKEKQLSTMAEAMTRLMRNQDTWFEVTVFKECQNQSILSLSKETRISRSYLTRAYNNGRELIKKEMLKQEGI